VKRVIACLLFVLLGLALAGPTVAHARTVSAQSEAQKKTQKYWKKASKQQAKAQKKQQKAQNKAAKKYNKNHPTRTTTT
jgi:hypothetical protein